MTTPPPPEGPSSPPADGALADRVGKLEQGQTSIMGKLDQLLTGQQQPAAPTAPERPEVGITQEIRDGLAAINTKLEQRPAAPAAEVAETPPTPPVRKITKFLWGGDD